MLITPVVDYEDSYNRYIEELREEERYPYPLDLDHSDFYKLVATLNNYSNGINLPDNLVPNTTYWLMKNNEIVGCSHLRHSLNESLRNAGGHIGLGIRPSMRGRGLGKELLNLTLNKAILMGIKNIHIHCYEHNQITKSLLYSVGATLDSIAKVSSKNENVLRYVYTRT